MDVTVHVPAIMHKLVVHFGHSVLDRNTPSSAENIEYSCVVTPDTVCVSRIFPGLPPFLGLGSDRWYVNVNGGSPISVKTISAWSPARMLAHRNQLVF